MNFQKSLAVEIMGTVSIARSWFSSGIPKLTLLFLLLFVNSMQRETMGVGIKYATFLGSTQEEDMPPSCSTQDESSQNPCFQGYQTVAVPTNEMSTTGLPGAQSQTASLPMVSGGRKKRKPLSIVQSPPQVTPTDPEMEELALAYKRRTVARRRRYQILQEANRRREIHNTRQKHAQRQVSALPLMAVHLHLPALPYVQALWSQPPAEVPLAQASPCQALLEQNTQTRRRALPRNEDDHDAALTLLEMHERREEMKGGRK